MKEYYLLAIFLIFLCVHPAWGLHQEDFDAAGMPSKAIFDDKAMLEGYAQKYEDEPKETILAMIGDDSLGAFKCSAAIHVFNDKYANGILSNQKSSILRILMRRLNRTDSPFVQTEIMHTLVVLDRYQYFESMVPALILKIDHYNAVVSKMAYDDIKSILKDSTYSREARIVFNTLRKVFFLSRNRLQNITKPDERLSEKLDLLHWSIKILGPQELKRLPQEVINLL